MDLYFRLLDRINKKDPDPKKIFETLIIYSESDWTMARFLAAGLTGEFSPPPSPPFSSPPTGSS